MEQEQAAHIRTRARTRAARAVAGQERPIRTSRVQLEPTVEAPLLARRVVEALLDENDSGHFSFSLRLVASELVNNAFLYGSRCEPIRMELELSPAWAEVRIQNIGSRVSITSLRARRRGGGRGLEIVDALADAWSIETGPLGTRVTVRLPVEAGR
jgi:anti-sigma regulatory factor (Ser/Thr protein kinase)